ncbi:MFS transporter [Halolamina sp.]|jgi:predicted MFS family arabinose efflux permease|uniref:MFS transporter n=1 Tax=Halolamina sp. TaxID=1940283 RepID=UPI000223BFA7|nr:major facilitator superfamily MFS_1 [halophilic archaeon DL31]
MSDGRAAAPRQGGVSLTLRLLPHALVASTGYVLFAVAALPDLLSARLGIGLSAFGLLTSAPLGAFVLVQPLASWLSDHRSTARVLLWATAVHIALSVALDLAGGFATLLALRFVWGLVAGLVLSVGATHIARLRRGPASTLEQGVFGGMLTLGGAAAFLFAGPVVAATGGPGLHAVGIGPGLVALACGLRHRRDRRTAPRSASAGHAPGDPEASADGASGRSTWDTLATVTNPTVLAAGLSYVAVIGSYITLSTFITSYFGELGVHGPLNALVLVGATAGRVSGGVAGWRLRVSDTAFVVVSVAAGAAGFAALATGPGGWLLVALPFATMVALSVPFGAVFNLAAGATDAEGVALAAVVAAGNVAALVLPPLAGAIRAATGGYASVFAMLALLDGVAAAGVFALARRRDSDGLTENS